MELPKSVLVKNQKIGFKKDLGNGRTITATVRHDDECGNGHNSFSITGEIRNSKLRGPDKVEMCGCIHEEIMQHFPDLVPLIKWHLTSTDGPMHYVSNALYLVSDKDCWGYKKGEPKDYKTAIFFSDVPIPLKDYGTKFVQFVKDTDPKTLTIVECPYKDQDRHKFSPKYTFNQFNTYKDKTGPDWYGAPFDSLREAEQVLEALKNCLVSYQTFPTSVGEGKTPDLEAARNAAIWPEATLEDFTKEKLEARLPSLMIEFKKAVESLGLKY